MEQMVELNASITALTDTILTTQSTSEMIALASLRANLTVKLNSIKAWQAHRKNKIKFHTHDVYIIQKPANQSLNTL